MKTIVNFAVKSTQVQTSLQTYQVIETVVCTNWTKSESMYTVHIVHTIYIYNNKCSVALTE